MRDRHEGIEARRHEVVEGKRHQVSSVPPHFSPLSLVPTPCLRAGACPERSRRMPACLPLHPPPPSSSVPNFQTNPPQLCQLRPASHAPAPHGAPSARFLQNEPTAPLHVSCLHVSRFLPCVLAVLAARLPTPPRKNRKTNPKVILSHPPKPARTCPNPPPQPIRQNKATCHSGSLNHPRTPPLQVSANFPRLPRACRAGRKSNPLKPHSRNAIHDSVAHPAKQTHRPSSCFMSSCFTPLASHPPKPATRAISQNEPIAEAPSEPIAD
jgi:hypothetical protein